MFKLSLGLFAALAVLSFAGCLPTASVKPNSPDNLERLKNLSEDEHAELFSGQYQGDMVMSDEEIQLLEEGGRSGRIAMIQSRYKWAGAVVPYQIHEADFTAAQIAHIHLGVRTMEASTCLKFVTYDPRVHNDFITVIGSNSGCYSSVGRRGTGEQILNLQPFEPQNGCFYLTTIIHEFFHAIGFYHMQSATERDEYVEIVWDKIQDGMAHNFNIYGANVITTLGVEYDYGSIMHYPASAFSIDGTDTILPLKDLNGQVMGQRIAMSEKDIERLNRHYCEGVEPTTTTEAATTTRRTPSIPGLVQSINSFVNNLLGNIWGSIRP